MPDLLLAASEGADIDLVANITVFVLAAFVGFEVISKVPTTLHTPLMSQTNAIHGIVVLGGLIVIGSSETLLTDVIGWIAIFFGTVNVVGGFLVTDRMLGMFIRKPKPKPEPDDSSAQGASATGNPAKPDAGSSGSDEGSGS